MEESECVSGGLSSPEKLVKEHFIVDELLDFPNDDNDDKVLFTVDDENVFDAEPVNSSESSTVATANAGGPNSKLTSDVNAWPNFLCGDLCEPYEELAELEWLSNFVEESFSSEDLEKLHLISGTKVQTEAQTNGMNTNHGTPEPGIFLPEPSVPGKARSKRSRAAASTAWSSSLLVISPSTSTSCESELLVPNNNGNATKKQGKKRRETPEKPSLAASDGRKCLHCSTDRTPQWRTGPLGPKTLCNACGVRYKSGRLVPEYRPAASPTFVLSKHSNSHRKVIELRRQKEMRQQQNLISGAAAMTAAGGGDEFLIDRRIGLEF
ncbi:GATA transcription factor 9 [Dioscorea cayenensis subsp. rotundata]|uniref:GATA transcription factor n=1 Tax=Dioscorea cayennensis subsp. rotundata TaxID=55577 RepID=A0AB40ANW0_DIOCR|nr:GATA transcription factor 9 [Dioscorea cayenensis subsp. rotundata]